MMGGRGSPLLPSLQGLERKTLPIGFHRHLNMRTAKLLGAKNLTDFDMPARKSLHFQLITGLQRDIPLMAADRQGGSLIPCVVVDGQTNLLSVGEPEPLRLTSSASPAGRKAGHEHQRSICAAGGTSIRSLALHQRKHFKGVSACEQCRSLSFEQGIETFGPTW